MEMVKIGLLSLISLKSSRERKASFFALRLNFGFCPTSFGYYSCGWSALVWRRWLL
ncbi:expressed protein [Arabidopsis lyrata subsp. lyrata]|uniref:Expressed protein n=1 Tax=Arabidopsis lyrata subsp. lyrata TaxID=81972 RepID=D7MH02_ARALL|nr:expressed protein [Arabidopsis lyrata subsp. lyrata]